MGEGFIWEKRTWVGEDSNGVEIPPSKEGATIRVDGVH